MTEHRENLISEIRAKRRKEELRNAEENETDDQDAADAGLDQKTRVGFELGIVHWLGTLYGTEKWKSPSSTARGLVFPSASATDVGGASKVLIYENNRGEWQSADQPEQWLQLKFTSCKVAPTSYSLRVPRKTKQAFPRNWTLLASNNGKHWILLKTHEDGHFKTRV